MSNLFDDLLTSTAEDGASATVGVLTIRHDSELEELMDAWLQERHENIENRMFLDRARRLLCRILADDQLTPETARSARSLITAIRASRHAERRNGDE